MDNQFNNGNQNYSGGQDYGATMPVDNPGFGQPQYNQSQYNQQNYGATMPVDNPGFSRQQYNQPNYGATMPVDNPGFNQPQYNQPNYGATMPVDNPGFSQPQYNQPNYGATMPVDNPGFSRQQYNQPNYGATMPVDNPGFSRQPVQQTNIQAGYGQQPVQNNAPKNKPPKNKKQGSKMSVGWLIALCASIVVIIVGVAIICFISVGKKKQINNVKDSSIKLTNASYSTTYGELFGKSITNGKWDYFKEDGEKLVQVKGDYKDPGSGSSFPVIVQFNVDDGVKLSCVAVNGVAYSLADSENFITLMYIAYYGTDDEKNSAYDDPNANVLTTEATTQATTQATTEATTQATTQATTEATTQATTEEEKNEYMLKNSSSEYLAVSDIAGMSKEQCRIARNEIYARHGRLFDDPELQAYFNSCSWYSGYIAPSDFDESVLNDYERSNLELIVAYEKDMGYR